jgi:hypothetical protein
MFTLEACATYDTVTTIRAAGVSQAQHDFDQNNCDAITSYSRNHTLAYERCMHMRGYDVALANGGIWPGIPPQQASIPETYTPPSSETPQESSIPSTAPSTGASLTPDQIHFARKAVVGCISDWIKYRDQGGGYVAKKCLQTAAEYGSIYVVKVYVCGHPNVIASLSSVSPILSEVVEDELQCRAA